MSEGASRQTGPFALKNDKPDRVAQCAIAFVAGGDADFARIARNALDKELCTPCSIPMPTGKIRGSPLRSHR